jgi:hypothetical protein
MQTKVDPAVPPHPEDAKLAAWLKLHESEAPGRLAMHIGIRATDGRIYRRITVQGIDEWLKCMRFLEDECRLAQESHGIHPSTGGLDAIFGGPPVR